MWVAKPVHRLSPLELRAWGQTIERETKAEGEAPLAQTLAWALATERLGVQTAWIGSLEKAVGGLVIEIPDRDGKLHGSFECQNGPLLHWDDPEQVMEELSLFASAVSQYAGSRFSCLTLRPRWLESTLSSRLTHLRRFETLQIETAATVLIDLKGSDQDQWRSLTLRLRRTLNKALHAGATTDWTRATPDLLGAWLPELQSFAKSNRFIVPPLDWFLTLAEHAPLFMSEARHEDSRAHALVALQGKRAHYLFGSRSASTRLGLGGLAQFRAFRECAALGARTYDLNGFLQNPPADHPYAGVAEFKAQFGGQVISYSSPEWVISAR